MNERIREIREFYKLSRASFGEKIKVSGDVINNLERGRVEVKEHIILLICREFNVSEEWLRTGNGEMFAQKKGFSFDDYIKQRNLSDIDVQILKVFAELQPKSRQDIIKNLQKIMVYIQEQNNEPTETELQQYEQPKAE